VNQLPLEGMPRRLYSAAPSRLMTFLDCPRRYRYQYLDRPTPAKGPPWAHNSLGASVHGALSNWWRLPVDERTVRRAGDLLERGWLTDGFRNDEHAIEQRSTARAMVERYVSDLDPETEPIGVERTVATKTDRAALFGRVDRIDDRGGDGVVIVDYKTGRHVLTVDDARTSLALAVYAAGASRVFHRPVRRVELHHLPTGAVLAWEHTDETLARQLARADSITDDLVALDERYRAGLDEAAAAAAFPARVGAQCAWCDFNRSCPDGRAIRPHVPWAGLADQGLGSSKTTLGST
jgi:RecB family exonuclease